MSSDSDSEYEFTNTNSWYKESSAHETVEILEKLKALNVCESSDAQQRQFITNTIEIFTAIPKRDKLKFSKFLIDNGIHVKVVGILKAYVSHSDVSKFCSTAYLGLCVDFLRKLCANDDTRDAVISTGVAVTICRLATQTDEFELFASCLELLKKAPTQKRSSSGCHEDYSLHLDKDLVNKCLSMLHEALTCDCNQFVSTILRFFEYVFRDLCEDCLCIERRRITFNKILHATCNVLMLTRDKEIGTLVAALNCISSLIALDEYERLYDNTMNTCVKVIANSDYWPAIMKHMTHPDKRVRDAVFGVYRCDEYASKFLNILLHTQINHLPYLLMTESNAQLKPWWDLKCMHSQAMLDYKMLPCLVARLKFSNGLSWVLIADCVSSILKIASDDVVCDLIADKAYRFVPHILAVLSRCYKKHIFIGNSWETDVICDSLVRCSDAIAASKQPSAFKNVLTAIRKELSKEKYQHDAIFHRVVQHLRPVHGNKDD